jgi:hypothetical protein
MCAIPYLAAASSVRSLHRASGPSARCSHGVRFGRMDMQAYLVEIRPAVELLLPGIWAERDQLAQLKAEVAQLRSTMITNYAQVESIVSSDIPDDDGIATGLYWDTYFGVDKEQHYKAIDLKELDEKVQTRTFAVGALAGTLLQFGKQGISLVHRGLGAAPSGRAIGSQSLKNVIWQGRNQSLHWEEGVFSPAVQDCFKRLAAEVDGSFADFLNRNMAMDVVEMLGWRTVADFESDLTRLA